MSPARRPAADLRHAAQPPTAGTPTAGTPPSGLNDEAGDSLRLSFVTSTAWRPTWRLGAPFFVTSNAQRWIDEARSP
jgi:hypothetical protein